LRFIALEKLINLHDGYRKEFRVDYHRILLLQVDGERYLIEAICPHQEHPLREGWIGDNCIECPLHQYRYSLKDGQLLYATEEESRGLKTWPVEYEGADVGLVWEEV
jgi:nitrite reductase/ring-hydroxylating ferredoxin subunit